jgi:phospholipase C
MEQELAPSQKTPPKHRQQGTSIVTMACLLSALLLLPYTSASPPGKIEHVVVAMLENRAFDHMLGWM